MTEAEMWFSKYIEALNGRGIVMCRDCKYFNEHATSPIVHCVLGTKIPDRKGNGFCSNGKRKAVEDDG